MAQTKRQPSDEPPPGPNLMPLLIQRALIQGFIVSDHPGREADFLRDVSGWLKEGKIGYNTLPTN